MQTIYLKSILVSDGYFGDKTMVHLCYDLESQKTLAITSYGYYNFGLPPAVDEQEAEWLLLHHPAVQQFILPQKEIKS